MSIGIERLQFEEGTNSAAKYLLMLTVIAVVAMALGSPWVAAKGPVADFPSRIAFNPDESPEGVAVDKVGNVHGNAYVAVVSQSAIVRINANDTQQQETIALYPFSPIDTPTSIAFRTDKGGRTSIFVTNMGWLSAFGAPYAPGTSLMKIDVGVPGLPLP